MAPKKEAAGESEGTAAPVATASSSYRLTKAQTEKALKAAQEVTNPVKGYGNLANKIASHARAGDYTAAVELTEAEAAMLGDWGVNIHEV